MKIWSYVFPIQVYNTDGDDSDNQILSISCILFPLKHKDYHVYTEYLLKINHPYTDLSKEVDISNNEKPFQY